MYRKYQAFQDKIKRIQDQNDQKAIGAYKEVNGYLDQKLAAAAERNQQQRKFEEEKELSAQETASPTISPQARSPRLSERNHQPPKFRRKSTITFRKKGSYL